MSIHKTSSAYVIKSAENSIIRVLEYLNPEVFWPQLLRAYFLEVGWSSMYPNFSTLRIGAVHPFALLLFQDVMGQKLDLSIFPAITITDSNDSEVYDTLGRNVSMNMYDGADIAKIKAGKTSKQFLISDENMTKLETAVTGDEKIAGKRTSFRANHTVDLTIWSDNKDLTSILYDAVKQFILASMSLLHKSGFDIQNPVSGRRSGDINVEFGKLLYGASVTVPTVIDISTMEFDVSTEAIVNIATDPEYHTT